MIRNIIFDWSGTISDDFGVLYEVVMEIFDEHGVKRVSREEFLKSYTLPYMASINQFFAIGKDEWDQKFKVKWEEKGVPNLLPGITQTLRILKSKGFRMAILTSHPEKFLKRELNIYFQEEIFFEGIFSGHYDKREAIQGMLAQLSFKPEETMLVGDTVHDIETGKHGNVRTVAVLSGYNSEESLRVAKPDFVISSVPELLAIL